MKEFFSESIKVLTKTFMIVVSKSIATKIIFITKQSMYLPIPSFYSHDFIKKLFPNHYSFKICYFHIPVSQKFTDVCQYNTLII